MKEILSALAIFKLTQLLMDYSGPFGVIQKLRDVFENNNILNFDCFFCMSTIVSMPFAFFLARGWPFVIYWFGLAGASLFLNSIYDRLEN